MALDRQRLAARARERPSSVPISLAAGQMPRGGRGRIALRHRADVGQQPVRQDHVDPDRYGHPSARVRWNVNGESWPASGLVVPAVNDGSERPGIAALVDRHRRVSATGVAEAHEVISTWVL